MEGDRPSEPEEELHEPPCKYPQDELRLCTWNLATLFGTGNSRGARLRPRWAVLNKLFYRHDIVCLQETHGHQGDLTTLDDRFP